MQPRTMPGQGHDGERTPLLAERSRDDYGRKLLEYSEDDEFHPRSWPKWKKLANIGVIASMSILSPLASSMFAPGIDEIADDLGVQRNSVIGCQTGFVIALGIGPLLLAPLSETFGRRIVYYVCFALFTLLQIPTALTKSLTVLITLRTFAGFFGSVSLANGGGTISDMYHPSERATFFGIYLLGPILGPTIGPLMGGFILEFLGWRWLFWVTFIISSVVLLNCFLFLRETYVPVLLRRRKLELEKSAGESYYIEGDDERPLHIKVGESIRRPLRILFTQPIVLIMSIYQALIFGTTYSLYTQFQPIYGPDGYGFSTIQIGLAYLGPGLGFLTAVIFLVPRIQTVFNALTRRNNGISKPEYRLPLANIGAVLIPTSLFAFAWLVQHRIHWFSTIVATYFYGIGQVMILNSVSNYYIDSFEKFAASAIAGGSLFRSLLAGIVPLITPHLLDKFGYGGGFSIFGAIGVLLAPSPLLFFYYGASLRERFAIKL